MCSTCSTHRLHFSWSNAGMLSQQGDRRFKERFLYCKGFSLNTGMFCKCCWCCLSGCVPVVNACSSKWLGSWPDSTEVLDRRYHAQNWYVSNAPAFEPLTLQAGKSLGHVACRHGRIIGAHPKPHKVQIKYVLAFTRARLCWNNELHEIAWEVLSTSRQTTLHIRT